MASEDVPAEFRVILPRRDVTKQVFDAIESDGPDEVQCSALVFSEGGASNWPPEEKGSQTGGRDRPSRTRMLSEGNEPQVRQARPSGLLHLPSDSLFVFPRVANQ